MPVSETRRIVDAYCEAWMTGNVDRARTFLADDLDFEGSIDSFSSADDFVKALARFVDTLVEVKVARKFFDGDEAMLLYDCVTDTPAGTIRTAEHLRVEDGRIREIRLVYDATELRKLAAS